MSKPTSGPWQHHPEDNIITTTDGRRLFEWQARSVHVSAEERDANARLIAAAPDLLEALKALRLAREQDKNRNWDNGVPEFNRAESLADVAIAKATGATS